MELESFARLISFAVALGVLTVFEVIFPRRPLNDSKNRRWFENITMTVFNTGVIRIFALFLPLLPAYLAINLEGAEQGLLNIIALPYTVKIIIAVLLLDLIIYLQHIMFHAVPLLWRLHMMHHSDLDFDLTTALRFHPVEIVISLFIKMGAVYVLGAPFLSVVIFEIVLNTAAMFNHSNIAIHPLADSIIRTLIVTPDMHRVHHSVRINETNSNFGFNFSFWDRIFGTYKPQPVGSHTSMTIGLSHNRKVERVNFLRLLLMPFTEDPGYYSLGRLPVRKKVTEK